MNKIYFSVLAALLLMVSCKPDITPNTPTKGSADFTKYVALGNSLTAGYSDNTLYRSGQENSYPSMLARAFAAVGGGPFRQPLLPGNYGWPDPKLILAVRAGCDGVAGVTPVRNNAIPDTAGSSMNIAAQGPYNNLAVPGIRCIHYNIPGYGMLNPYAGRFYPDPAATSPMALALGSGATFFTCWLGANDVLAYATSGGEGKVSGTGLYDISPAEGFQATYDALINGMTANGAKGVLINIPDVTTVPFFTTIPAKGLALTRQGQADSLNAAYAALGIKFNVGANYFIIQDVTAPAGLRQIKSGEYLLLTLPQDSIKCKGWGSIKPIPKQYVLDATEVANIRTATTTFNKIISDNAQAHGLALMDAFSYLTTLQSGITYNGVTYTPTFVTGGAFSLDGVHLTQRGYALVANEIIRVINATYGATIGGVDVNHYEGVRLP